MSQFRVQKVTKVKGPSELTGKASGDSTTKKTRSSSANTDRPQTQPRQKKSSTPKSAEAKNSSSSGDKQNASAPKARNRPTAAKRTTTAKTCPSQQGKKTSSPQTASKHSKSNADVNGTKSVPPKPSTKPRKESPPKKSAPLEKESSYDASESESDEHELSGKLSPKDDIGYETGSYDEIDASNSETTTPDAGQENKTILNQNREIDSAGYSYAVDFRPLIVAGDVGISTPIHTTHPDEFEVESSNDLFGNHPKERLSYAYASNEFRPLIITDEGGFSAPLDTDKPSEELHGLSSLESKRPPMRYEEVEIHSGKFDRTNVNVVQLNTVSSETNTAVENDDTTCSAVNNQDLSTPLNRTDQNPNGDQIGDDVYAVVQKDNKSAAPQQNSICAGETIKLDEIETPPKIPCRKDITRSDVYECITGELQNMIQACHEDDKNGENSCPGSNSVPPPLPKPYAGSRVQPATVPDTCEQAGGDDWGVSALYAEVQKKPKEKTYKLENIPVNQSPDDVPPPIPSRCNLDDTLGKEATSSKTGQDKDQKSGFGIFNIMHRRKLSDGNVVAMSGERCKSPPKKGHKRSKSQDCVSNNFDNLTKDSGNLIKAYLEVDITDPPQTPRDMQSVQSYWEDGDDQYMDGELPEGWKEVESENGSKYYWHVSSGTTQWEKPQVAPRPKKKMQGDQLPPAQVAEKQKVLSFPVHSMGWIELEETQVAPHNMGDTIADCISTLAKSRKDLWQTSETWGEGKDIRLLLEGDTLKLVEPRNKITLLVQPVSKMRVWGVGKEDHRDFAYVARDPNTSKHKCHMFRCHGNISGRAITTALHEMCNKILQEKKRAQEISKKASQAKPWSDIINTPAPLSAKDSAGFNEKPVREQKKDFTATYLGCSEVPKPTGMEMLNKAIHKVASKNAPKRTVLIQVTVSCIKLTDCTSQEEISEDRVRYLSFMGIGKDERLCGYIMANEPDRYLCHVFQCSPNAASLTKALEEACQLRYQKCLDAHPEMATRPVTAEQELDKTKDKVPANFMSSVQGLLGKLGPKKEGKKDDVLPSPPLPKPSHTFMVKYYGALPVAVGTGVETVEEAAKHLTGGTLLICQLDVAINGVTLYDSQRSSLSRRHMDADTISFCGLTSDNGHFGLIQCQGGGKYVCHVFSEYKTKAAPIVAAIHETL